MSHANAALTPRQRLRVARLVVEHGWPVSRAAEQFNCSWPTAKLRAERYAAMGQAGMSDRSSRPAPGREPDSAAARPKGRAPSLEAKAGTGRDWSEAGYACLDRPFGPGPVPAEPVASRG